MYNIYHCCVYSGKTPDDGQGNCPKRLEFYSKNKFELLVYLVGFIIRIDFIHVIEHRIYLSLVGALQTGVLLCL